MKRRASVHAGGTNKRISQVAVACDPVRSISQRMMIRNSYMYFGNFSCSPHWRLCFLMLCHLHFLLPATTQISCLPFFFRLCQEANQTNHGRPNAPTGSCYCRRWNHGECSVLHVRRPHRSQPVQHVCLMPRQQGRRHPRHQHRGHPPSVPWLPEMA